MRQTRRTRQEAAISSEISHLEEFFTAEELFRRVHARHPEMGKATVYRHVKKMSMGGGLHRFSHGRKAVYSSHPNNVAHFICERCGRISHLKLGKADFLGIARKDEGCKVCHFQLDVFGLCRECCGKGRT